MTGQGSRGRAALLVIAVFVLGAALGGVGTYSVVKRTVAASSVPMTDQQRHAHRVERLSRELSLTADQQKLVDEILAQWEARYKAIEQAKVPELDQARHDTRVKIREILTLEQTPKFEEFLRRIDQQRGKNAQH
jgi:Spy/CpxP family protein refolding chaperone